MLFVYHRNEAEWKLWSNLLLAAGKLIFGFMISSRAVMLDGLNSLSDMITSVVTMISTLYAGKRSDREHPFGYGRLEYITSMFTTVFILTMGAYAIFDAVRELVSKSGDAPDYNMATIVMLCISLTAKFVYGLLSRKAGKRVNSVALMMIGTETLGDGVISLSILVAIVIQRMMGIDIEAWLSILISIFIIKAGIEMIGECMKKLLGKKSDPEVYRGIKKMIAEEPDVLNVFNLVIHNYGEELSVGSVDIEVDEEMKTSETTKLMRRIIHKAAKQGVTLSSVGIYGAESDPKSLEIWDRVLEVVRAHSELVRASAFSYDQKEQIAAFNVLTAPSVRNRRKCIGQLEDELEGIFPGITFHIEAALDE